MKQENNILYLISGAYLLALLAILAIFGYTPTNDGDGYIEFAQVCIQNNQSYPGIPSLKGYPFVWNIGAINLTALSLLLFHSIYPLLILMCCMKAATAYYISKIAQRLWNGKVGICACCLFVLYPNNWGQSTTILSETPMIFLAITAFYIAISKDKCIWLFISGLLFGLANWVRPVAMVYMGTLILYYLFFVKTSTIKKCSSLCVGYLLFICVVGIHNYHKTGYFIYQAESLWFNMAESTYEKSVAPQYGTDPYPKGTARYIENMSKKTAIECNEIWKERSIAWLKEHPVQYLKKIPGRLLYMYYNDMDYIIAFSHQKDKAENNFLTLPYRNILAGTLGKLSAVQYLALVNLFYYLLLLIFAICGGYLSLRKHEYRQVFLPLMIILGGSLSLVLAIHGETRFKAPFMPFIFMLAAITLSSWLYQAKSQKLKTNDTSLNTSDFQKAKHSRMF